MFLQVIQGRVPDRSAMRVQHDRWLAEIGSDAPGWLGSTAGVTEDDRFVCLSRFSSAEALVRLGARTDQREWWARTERLFLGPVVTAEFHDVEIMLEGGADDASFVQVVQGRATDTARLAVLQKELLRHLPDGRPDMIGGLAAVGPDGRFMRVFYFSDEELARAGEHGEPLPEVAEIDFDLRELSGEPTYHDLRHPWLASPPPAGPAAGRAGETSASETGAGAARSAAKAGSEPWSQPDRRAAARRR
ncbi:hypothetical protein I6A84_08970 [Frankia sp. CNm7]|uniref:Antibiotic biosynthesis monooxygenase n=2 Tax=Frankia nepalensis TaxID=1836974 RepID=A0A937RIJ3_9ACTN|nr:hypothetical protein [Frankia nepalensis]MBL7515190.1 hypothetical protein [Frankia nepalensis]MBL7518241.1 hypothetical protein [Frankia nepalensis]MBL7629479.1 hypothetical protein [Frankia nepalensis]